MAFEFAMLPGEPLMLIKLHSDFKMQDDTPVLIGMMKRALDTAPDRVTIIGNLPGIMLKFSDMVYAMGIATKGDTAILHHPCIRKLVLVTTSDTIRFGGFSLQQEQYGGLRVEVYATMDEALKSIRAVQEARPLNVVLRPKLPRRVVAQPAEVGQWF
jgi:hypothetical protein